MVPRVLIIEDDCDFAESLILALSMRNIESETANTGHKGISMFSSGQYDVTLTDIRLPDISGIDVLCSLRTLNEHAHVTVMTGYREHGLIEQARQHGATNILLKPFRIDEFIKQVECHMN